MAKIEQELAKAEQTLSTDSYSMSIGELISSYKDGEIEVNPAFQRTFRWSDFAKSRLIESFLLGLPVPPIFVYQRASGNWELIDGLQRVSSILQFVGELRDKQGQLVPALSLTSTKYLPSLFGVHWKAQSDDDQLALPDHVKLKFRKARIDVKIILAKSTELSKYELFDRLNTGGSPATPAEVRNCLILMKDPNFFEWLDGLVAYPSFVETTPLTDRQLDEQYRFELLVRYFVLQSTPPEEARAIDDLETYLNDKVLEMADPDKFDRATGEATFRETFDRLNRVLEDNVFRRLNVEKSRFVGPFLLAAYEVIALGVALNIETVRQNDDAWLKEKIESLWHQNLLKSIGLRSSQRLAQTLPLARVHFQ
jgi:hypothetical protein